MKNTHLKICEKTPSKSLPTGIHILGDFFNIDSSVLEMTDLNLLKKLCVESVIKSNLTIISKHFYKFEEQGGITGIVLLAESHLAIHTWPEKNYLSLDVFVCNICEDNSNKARKIYNLIKDIFKPGNVKYQEVLR